MLRYVRGSRLTRVWARTRLKYEPVLEPNFDVVPTSLAARQMQRLMEIPKVVDEESQGIVPFLSKVEQNVSTFAVC